MASLEVFDRAAPWLIEPPPLCEVRRNDHYDLQSPEHYAAIDVRIEGCTKADQENFDLALAEVLSPKDREALNGASNAGYHYSGSAKIFAQMARRSRGPSCLFRNE
jgi:hypothetical protein